MERAKTSVPEIDILHCDCLSSYDSVACTRNVVLCVLSVCTALLCVVRVIRLHMQHSQAYHHYCIFYLATFSCCMGGINWVLGGRSQMHVALQFLKLLMFLVLSHFYWVLASRALRCEAAVKRIMYPAVGGVMLYYVITAVLAMLNMTSDGSQCMEPYWLLMSAMEVVLVQFFALAAVHITRRLNEISTLDSVRWAQKRDLWCIVFVLEFSAVVTLLYDITVQIVGDKEEGCGAIFNYQQSLYSPIFGTFMVIKLLIPIWAMLYAFQPNVVNGDQEQTYPAYSEDGTCGSAYSDDSQYRQLYHPTDMYHSVANSCLPDPICEEGSSALGGRKGSQQGMLAAARNIPKESGKCFSWLTNPSPGKIYL
ncbi:hypothetical protein ACOMHN_020739 [Nucella lapillus]